MQQVPTFAVIGNGRLARHMIHYLRCLNIHHRHWFRAAHTPQQLHQILSSSTHALILICDDSIESFVAKHIIKQHPKLLCVHCSGCLVSDLCYGAHPLQTFSQQTWYTVEQYAAIPFMVDAHAPPCHELLPGINNPFYRISAKDKPYYHALCVLANNVTTVLWQKFYREMDERFAVPAEAVKLFITQTFHNIMLNPHTALTGPLSRGDTLTVAKNLQALRGDDFYHILHAVAKRWFTDEELMMDNLGDS